MHARIASVCLILLLIWALEAVFRLTWWNTVLVAAATAGLWYIGIKHRSLFLKWIKSPADSDERDGQPDADDDDHIWAWSYFPRLLALGFMFVMTQFEPVTAKLGKGSPEYHLSSYFGISVLLAGIAFVCALIDALAKGWSIRISKFDYRVLGVGGVFIALTAASQVMYEARTPWGSYLYLIKFSTYLLVWFTAVLLYGAPGSGARYRSRMRDFTIVWSALLLFLSVAVIGNAGRVGMAILRFVLQQRCGVF